jgi:biopolymer transport protein ExbB/TolQ
MEKRTEKIVDIWRGLSAMQRNAVIYIVAVLVALIGISWMVSFGAWGEVYKAQEKAKTAKQESEKALAQAAKLAREIQAREKQLIKLEVNRENAKSTASTHRQKVDRARDSYQRTRDAPRDNVPSASQLCQELAELGYPC